MAETRFTEQLQKTRECLTALSRQAGNMPSLPAMMQNALDRLSSALDDLTAASEGLSIPQNLAAMERRLASYVNLARNAPNAIVLVDREYRLAFVNTAYARLHRMDEHEMVGKPLVEIIGEEHYQIARPQLDRVFQGEMLDFTTWYTYPDGDRFMHVYYYPIQAQGKVELVGVIFTDLTERARTEETLRESEERYRATFEQAAVGLAHVGLDGRWLRVNNKLCEMFEYSCDELLAQTLMDVTYPEDLEITMAYVGQLLNGKIPSYTIDKRYVRKDGSVIWTTMTTTLRRDQQGKPLHYITVIQDISRRKQVEQALIDSEERFRAFSEATSEGIVLHEEGRIIELNPAIHEHLGYTEEEMLGQSVLDFTAPESREEMLQRILVNDPGPYMAISLHKDGSRTIGEIRAREIRYKGRPIRVVAIRDITDLKQAEARREELLHRTETWAAEMDAIFSSIADIITVVDMEGKILRMNRVSTELMAMLPEHHPTTLTELLTRFRVETPDGQPLSLDDPAVIRVFHGEAVHNVIIMVHFPSERTLWVSASAGPICLPDGRQTGVVFSSTDITALHELQEERDVYIHTISHDMRAPLAVINGHADVLADELQQRGLDGELVPSVEAIQRSATRMNVMIQDLVDAARYEGGQLSLNCEEVDLRAYLDNLLQRNAAVLEAERITVEMADDLPPVWADYNRLERIFTNLLSNALKYSDPGTPVLVRGRRADGIVEISITDQGRGIAPEDLPHIFDRFYQPKEGRKAEGIGLGLYITRMLVEAHSGQIRVESTPGKGSTFTFTLTPAPAK